MSLFTDSLQGCKENVSRFDDGLQGFKGKVTLSGDSLQGFKDVALLLLTVARVLRCLLRFCCAVDFGVKLRQCAKRRLPDIMRTIAKGAAAAADGKFIKMCCNHIRVSNSARCRWVAGRMYQLKKRHSTEAVFVILPMCCRLLL